MGDHIKRFDISGCYWAKAVGVPIDIKYNDVVIGRAIRTGVDKVEAFIDSDHIGMFKLEKASLEVVLRDEKVR